MRVETDLADPETIELIAKVLEDFGKEQQGPLDEDEAMFCVRFGDFERKTKKSAGQGRVRQTGMKRVSEVYTIERLQREKIVEKERIERELRQD